MKNLKTTKVKSAPVRKARVKASVTADSSIKKECNESCVCTTDNSRFGRIFLGLFLVLIGLFYLSRNLGFLPMTNFNFQFIWPVLFILAGLLLTNRHSRISIIVGVFSALVFMLIVTFIVNYGQVRDEYGTEAVMPALRHVERAKTVSSITEVKLDNFKVGEIVSSPLSIEGSALGTWFFEGSFPVKVLDQSGQELGRGVAQAQESWMTTGFVPFKASIVFTKPTSSTGSLVLQKDNPSGLSQNDKQVVFPINF